MHAKEQGKGSGFWGGAIVGLIIGLAIGGGAYYGQARIINKLEAELASQQERLEGNEQLEGKNRPANGGGETAIDMAGRAGEILEALKEQDFEELALYAHPLKGVRFTPYTRVNVEKDLILSREQLQKGAGDKSLLSWGSYDGSGLPIDLTIAEYFKEFVYDQDYLAADKVGHDRPVTEEETDNSRAIYPEAYIAEYHFAGSEEYGGMDWSSLKLVLEEYNGEPYLVGIIHAQWTI